MLGYWTIGKKSWEFGSFIMQNTSHILLLFCTPTWPSNHVKANQEYDGLLNPSIYFVLFQGHVGNLLRKEQLWNR